MRPLAPLLLALLAGCGTAGADLMVVQRSGSIPGAGLRMRVIDDGRVVCNGARYDLPSAQLIAARDVARDLAGAARRRTRLAPGPGAILRLRIRTADGIVAFSDTSPRQPRVFYRAAQLVRTIAKGACGLPR